MGLECLSMLLLDLSINRGEFADQSVCEQVTHPQTWTVVLIKGSNIGGTEVLVGPGFCDGRPHSLQYALWLSGHGEGAYPFHESVDDVPI